MPRGELTPIHFEPQGLEVDFDLKKKLYIPSQELELPEMRNECGLLSVHLSEAGLEAGIEVAPLIYQGETDLQHRAEGSSAIVISNGIETRLVKGLGEAKAVFGQGRNLPKLKDSYVGLGHMRYPTAGSGGMNHENNIQPFELDGIWLGHHGNLTNAKEIEERIGHVDKDGVFPNSDSWVALNAVVRAQGGSLGEKVVNAQRNFEGAWSLILTDGVNTVASRDPYGIRPLFLGYLGSEEQPKGWVLSVETCVFKNMGVKDFIEILPGETIQINQEGVKTIDMNRKGQMSCIFEFVYMSHPDSRFLGQLVHKTRRRAGELLWLEAPIELEEGEKLRVMPVPNSGRPAAAGFASEARKVLGDRVDLEEGLLANAYYGRNFIKPSSGRDARKKFYTVDYLIEGQTIALVDDSRVRGDTSQALFEMLYEARANKAHDRVASPEINFPCYGGVAFGKLQELFTHRISDPQERQRFLRVASSKHLSLDGLLEAVEISKDKLCTFCFDGKPLPFSVNGVIPLAEA